MFTNEFDNSLKRGNATRRMPSIDMNSFPLLFLLHAYSMKKAEKEEAGFCGLIM